MKSSTELIRELSQLAGRANPQQLQAAIDVLTETRNDADLERQRIDAARHYCWQEERNDRAAIDRLYSGERNDADLERERIDAVQSYMWREDSLLEQTHPDSAPQTFLRADRLGSLSGLRADSSLVEVSYIGQDEDQDEDDEQTRIDAATIAGYTWEGY
jgi:hypothetical protein